MGQPDQPQNPLQVVPRVLQDIEKNLELLVEIGYYNQAQKLFLSHYLQKFDHALRVTEKWSKPSSEEDNRNVAVDSIVDAASVKIEASQSAKKTSVDHPKEQGALDEEPSFSWAQAQPFRSDSESIAKTLRNLDPQDQATLKSSMRYVTDRDLIFTGRQVPFSKGDICRLCENYGKVESCQIILNPKTRISSGIGIARMASADQASAVIEGLQGVVIGGCTINIMKALQYRTYFPVIEFERGSNSSLKIHTSTDHTSQISANKDDVSEYDYEEYVSKSRKSELTPSEDVRNDNIHLHGHSHDHGYETTQPVNTSVQPGCSSNSDHRVKDRISAELVVSNLPKSKAVAKEVEVQDEKNIRKLREHKAEMDRFENEILEKEQKRRTVDAQASQKDSLEMRFVPATESLSEHNGMARDQVCKQTNIIAPFQPTNKWGKPIPRDPTRNYPGDMVGASASPFGKGNIGRDLVEKMGWKDGEGLGPNGEGRPDLITGKVNFSTGGLGVETLSELGPGSVGAELPNSEPATIDFGAKQAWDMALTEEEYRQKRAEEAVLRRAAKDSSSVRARKTKGIIANFLQEGAGSDEPGKTIKFTACVNRDFKTSRHFPGAIIKVLEGNTGDIRGISGLYGAEQLEIMNNDVLELTGQHHKYVLAYNERTQKSGFVRIAWVNIIAPVHSNQTQAERVWGESRSEKDIASPGQLGHSITHDVTGGWTAATNSDHTLTEDERTRSLRGQRSNVFASTASIPVRQMADKPNTEDEKDFVNNEDDDDDDIYGYEVGWNATTRPLPSQPTHSRAVDWNASFRDRGSRPRTYHTSTGKVITENSNMPVVRGPGPQSRVPPPRATRQVAR